MHVLRARALLVTAMATLVLVGSVRAAADTVPRPPAASVQAELADTAVQVDMMISLTPTPLPAGAMGAGEAQAAAASWLGRTDAPAVLVHGSGQQTASDAATDGWIVVFAGGVYPLRDDGSVTLDFIGVLLDDRTGEALRTFGRGHPATSAAP